MFAQNCCNKNDITGNRERERKYHHIRLSAAICDFVITFFWGREWKTSDVIIFDSHIAIKIFSMIKTPNYFVAKIAKVRLSERKRDRESKLIWLTSKYRGIRPNYHFYCWWKWFQWWHEHYICHTFWIFICHSNATKSAKKRKPKSPSHLGTNQKQRKF